MQHNKKFTIVGYSFGTLVAIEIVRRLEKKGCNGKLILLDGSPQYIQGFMQYFFGHKLDNVSLLDDYFTIVTIPFQDTLSYDTIKASYSELLSYTGKMEKLSDYTNHQTKYSLKYLEENIHGLVNRIHMVYQYTTTETIATPITLIRPKEAGMANFAHDYNLNGITSGKVDVQFINGNHTTMLSDNNLSTLLNELI